MESRLFGKIADKEIKVFTLSSDKLFVEILNYGAIIRSIKVKDKDGNMINTVLGYDTLEEYVADKSHYGSTIGRVCNRIANAKFTLNGKEYKVSANEKSNCLHGGFSSFDKKIWDYEVSGETLQLSYLSPDKEEGFPGNLNVKIRFFVENDSLNIQYFATSDSDTLCNLTNHSYFSLSGGKSESENELRIFADYYTPTNEELIPTGEIASVKETPYDFTKGKTLGKDITACFPRYDINYVLNSDGFRQVAECKCFQTGLKLKVFTDANCMQLYFAKIKGQRKGIDNNIYKDFAFFCLETQNYVDAINHENFASCILKKGEEYKTTTVYKFENQ